MHLLPGFSCSSFGSGLVGAAVIRGCVRWVRNYICDLGRQTVITRPIRATVGNPRCGPISPGSGTVIVPEYEEFLNELGISYRQWNYWQSEGWLPNAAWYEIANNPTLRTRAEDLADASRLKAMSLPEIADYLAQERGND